MVKPQSFVRREQEPSLLLDVQHITFGYGDKPLLYDVSLQVQKGEMVGLLGPNGSGKTTLLRLVSGLFSPQQGRVLLEGRTLQQWGRRGAAQRIAVVPQEVDLFSRTIRENLAYGRDSVTGAQLESAARAAQALTTILGMQI